MVNPSKTRKSAFCSHGKRVAAITQKPRKHRSSARRIIKVSATVTKNVRANL
jgi:hypothetical protein